LVDFEGQFQGNLIGRDGLAARQGEGHDAEYKYQFLHFTSPLAYLCFDRGYLQISIVPIFGFCGFTLALPPFHLLIRLIRP
jgi:hypothetical protein